MRYWVIKENDGAHAHVFDNKGERVAKVWLQGSNYNDDNAKLVAAAPELLRALQEMVSEQYESDLLGYLDEDSSAYKILKKRLEMAESALRKAKGEL